MVFELSKRVIRVICLLLSIAVWMQIETPPPRARGSEFDASITKLKAETRKRLQNPFKSLRCSDRCIEHFEMIARDRQRFIAVDLHGMIQQGWEVTSDGKA
ncbi:hypothetical protein BC940DRAFT_316292 [Gongronella butleri]|nr:hypothetical protein BC940DRAFT_316292 [Gongronella butleri]